MTKLLEEHPEAGQIIQNSKKTYLLNKFFFHSIKTLKPYTKVKMAISLDEKIAWSDYKSKWISNIKSRSYGHKIRARSQAILTTSKTIIKDNPRFTIRDKSKVVKHLPIIIVDKNLKPWLIEMNVSPSSTAFDQLGEKQKQQVWVDTMKITLLKEPKDHQFDLL